MVLGFLRRRREKRERNAELRNMGEAFAESFKADLNLFLETQVVPTRQAFLGVHTDQLTKLDERISEFDEPVTRDQLARLDFRILVENWTQRQQGRADAAAEWMAEHLDIADAVGTRDEMEQYIMMALADQDLKLYAAGIDATAAVIGDEAVSDLR